MKAILSSAVLLFCSSAMATLINGAGASFPYPLYAKWFSDFHKLHSETRINYQSIGSGGGVRQFTQGTVDFGASDAPMTDTQIEEAKKPVLHVPTVLGAVVVTFHVPELKTLQLNGSVLGEIFLGTIAKWDDPKIAALNPGVQLPSKAILVVHRSDGSGTTQIFTDFLAKTSATWKTKVGSGTAVKWPAGLGGKGNEGVAGLIKQTPGSIGYTELIYAVNNHLSYASIQNRTGAFIVPDLKSVTAAAQNSTVPEDFRVSITDADGKQSYPISGFTYILVWKNQKDEKATKFIEFLKWALKDGQAAAAPLHYAPLPASLVKRVKDQLETPSAQTPTKTGT